MTEYICKYIEENSHWVDSESGSIWFNRNLMNQAMRVKHFGDEKKVGRIGVNIGAWRIECEGYYSDLDDYNGGTEHCYFFYMKFYHSTKELTSIDLDSDGVYAISIWKKCTDWEFYALKSMIKLFSNGKTPRVYICVTDMDHYDACDYCKALLGRYWWR